MKHTHIIPVLAALLLGPLAALHAAETKTPAAAGNFAHWGGPISPNPGLKYWYPLPKLDNPQTYHVDVCVYGGTPGGVAAAVQSARMGKSAILAAFGRHIGGMVSGGLTATDMGNPKAAGGLAREFYYKRLPRASNFSPALAEKEFESMLLESGATVLYEHRLQSVEKQGNHISALVFENGNRIEAKMFVDASYEGDLLARAGVSYFVGREANSVYGETLNGYQVTEDHQFLFPVDPYKTPGDPASGLLPEIMPGPHPSSLTGTGDKQVMAYCFRMNATTAENRIPFPKPKNYNPEDYELLLRYLTVKPDFHWPLTYQAGPVKLNEGDCNSTGPVSLDATGKSWDWPEAGYERREQIFQDHVTYDQGLMWFLANDPRVPEALRLRVQKYGLPKNEFVETGGWPHELYVREGRRMISDYVITERNCKGEVVAPDGIGLASFLMDSHICSFVVMEGFVKAQGVVNFRMKNPYPISYRSIIPKSGECDNLLVPVALSSSHIAYGSMRMEPVYMILGQSAGTAAVLAIEGSTSVQGVDYQKLKTRLLSDKQKVTWDEPSNPQPGTRP